MINFSLYTDDERCQWAMYTAKTAGLPIIYLAWLSLIDHLPKVPAQCTSHLEHYY